MQDHLLAVVTHAGAPSALTKQQNLHVTVGGPPRGMHPVAHVLSVLLLHFYMKGMKSTNHFTSLIALCLPQRT